MALNIIKRDCPQCGADNSDKPNSPYSYQEWHIKSCACGFVYIDSAPDYQHLIEEMDWDTTFAAEVERRKEIKPLLYRFSKLTRFRMKVLPRRTVGKYILSRHSSGNIVDLGCGSGGQIIDLAGPFVPHGIDISAKLAKEADTLFRPYGGSAMNAPCTEGLQKFPRGFFVAASLRSYLEHEMRPLEVLTALHGALRDDGIAVVKVPNYACWNRYVMGSKWCGFRYPDHLNYFTPQSLRQMADTAGFKTDFGIVGCLPTSDNMWAVLTKK